MYQNISSDLRVTNKNQVIFEKKKKHFKIN